MFKLFYAIRSGQQVVVLLAFPLRLLLPYEVAKQLGKRSVPLCCVGPRSHRMPRQSPVRIRRVLNHLVSYKYCQGFLTGLTRQYRIRGRELSLPRAKRIKQRSRTV